MPSSCCVVGCVTRRGPKASASGISLFRIPANPRQRRAWVSTIARKDWQPKAWERVCGKHFVSGWPSDDPDDVDYRPTLLMKGEASVHTSSNSRTTPRHQRASERIERLHLQELAQVLCCAVAKLSVYAVRVIMLIINVL